MNLATSLKEGLVKFRSLAKLTHQNPSVENVHDLRVLVRRLRSHLWLIPKQKRRGVIGSAYSELKEKGRILGEQRMYDVALIDAKRYQLDREKLQKAQAQAQRRVIESFKPENLRELETALERAIGKISEMDPRKFCARIQLLQETLKRASQSPPKKSSDRHQLRINVKKARYLLHAFGIKIASLNKLQRHLGRWHDLRILQKLAGKTPKLKSAKKKQWTKASRLLSPAIAQVTELVIRHQNEGMDFGPA